MVVHSFVTLLAAMLHGAAMTLAMSYNVLRSYFESA